jgi:hypothetical protein
MLQRNDDMAIRKHTSHAILKTISDAATKRLDGMMGTSLNLNIRE